MQYCLPGPNGSGKSSFLKIFSGEINKLQATVLYINRAAHYADNLFFLKEGELVVHGRPKDILSAVLIEKVFNIKITVIGNLVTGKPLIIYN